ncbi:hypothetical protein EYV94_23955 [Puteibacter caeruleilacunae]|nr:hypothetical protein EYV94_23955 [Puteibacter caeruleilacunae]
MKKQLLLYVGLCLLMACTKVDYQTKYRDFNNAWERENLHGQVKSLVLYKADFSDNKGLELNDRVVCARKEFTNFGELTLRENYDRYGSLNQSEKFIYDEANHMVKYSNENFTAASVMVEHCKYDELGNKIASNVTYNDYKRMTASFEYDDRGNIINQTQVDIGDTATYKFEYKYNDKGDMCWKKRSNVKSDGLKAVNEVEFAYDEKGNLISVINKSDIFGEMKSLNEYDKQDLLRKTTQYKDGEISKETTFDEYFNPELVKFYKEGKLIKEMKYEYDFDRQGNWTSRKIAVKELRESDAVFTPVVKESRDIKYFS